MRNESLQHPATPDTPSRQAAAGDRLLTKAELKEYLRIKSDSAIWDLEKKGHLPASVRIGPKAVRWWLGEVNAYLENGRGQKSQSGAVQTPSVA